MNSRLITGWSLLAVLVMWTSDTRACSGPGAMAMIEAAERLGWLLFGISAAAGLAGLVLMWKLGRSRWQMCACLIPVVIHPGWWLGARGGDCGAMRTIGSWIGIGLAVAVPLILLIAARKKPQ